jgi:mannose-6-phosphate isomerase
MELTCNVQTYAWGKKGSESLVARSKGGADGSFVVDDNTPYAEYWMGTHPNNPSLVRGSEELLSVWLTKNPAAVGVVPDGYPADNIPFLFKILSIGKTLSIQVHPDQALGRELHASRPDVYKDPNHKPEMSIALTRFEAMCGLRPRQDVEGYIKDIPELGAVCGIDGSTDTPITLEALWRTFLTMDDAVVEVQLAALKGRLQEKRKPSQPPAGGTTRARTVSADMESIDPCELSLRLMSQFPGDRGAFCPFLLKCLCLEPGEAFFMGPNQPHAYVSGDCLEVMAPSDNVIRAALTPKYKDTDTLISTIDYSSAGGLPIVQPIKVDDNTTTYRPPCKLAPEFELHLHKYSHNDNEGAINRWSLQQIDCCSIVLVMDGALTIVDDVSGVETSASAGSVLFIPANTLVTVKLTSDSTTFYRTNRNLGTEM